MHLFSPLSLFHLTPLLFISFFPIQTAALIQRLIKPLSFRSGFIQTEALSSPGDQIALWFYVDESKSQLLQVVSMLRHARLSSHFERLAHHKRAHFISIQFDTDREKRGVPSESLAFGGRLTAARKLSDPAKKHYIHMHYISTCMAKSALSHTHFYRN